MIPLWLEGWHEVTGCCCSNGTKKEALIERLFKKYQNFLKLRKLGSELMRTSRTTLELKAMC